MSRGKQKHRAGRRRPVVPVGPRYQVVVPAWKKPEMKALVVYDSAYAAAAAASAASISSPGTRIWPREGIPVGNDDAETGRGRPESCTCDAPGSLMCNSLHINEERARVQTELGTVFQSWNFDRMGEVVTISWAEEQQKQFKKMVKNPRKVKKGFIERAMKAFSKTRDEVVSYYFNVHLPRMFSSREVQNSDAEDSDSDDDGKKKSKKSKKGKRAVRNRAPFLVGRR